MGASIKDEEFEHESRYLTTKEFNVEGGGVVTYYVKYNDPKVPGGQQCVVSCGKKNEKYFTKIIIMLLIIISC